MMVKSPKKLSNTFNPFIHTDVDTMIKTIMKLMPMTKVEMISKLMKK